MLNASRSNDIIFFELIRCLGLTPSNLAVTDG